MTADFHMLHAQAVREGRRSYTDPDSGYRVFTELAHLQRGTCCGSCCRHCPFGHIRVERTAPRDHAPWWQLSGSDAADGLDVVSWSGGKDAYLALRSLDPVGRVVLFTTYDPVTARVPVQDVPLDVIRQQARLLRVDLLAVPVGSDYLAALRAGVDVLRRRAPIRRLSFGDLHLEDVRRWREETLADVPLAFPLWRVSYDELFTAFERSGAAAHISATTLPEAPVGASFGRAFADRLPVGVDRFGENGEFHTQVSFSRS